MVMTNQNSTLKRHIHIHYSKKTNLYVSLNVVAAQEGPRNRWDVAGERSTRWWQLLDLP